MCKAPSRWGGKQFYFYDMAAVARLETKLLAAYCSGCFEQGQLRGGHVQIIVTIYTIL